MTTPNLFNFATSELSQDAFVCWLLSWSDPVFAASEPELHKAATSLLDQLLERGKVQKPDIYGQVVIKRQVNRIDILVEVNDDITVLIEDKTFTQHHSGQLERYLSAVCQQRPRDKVAAIYLKTGDQSTYTEIEKAGFAPFLRSDLLRVLQRAEDVRSDIFRDFTTYLKGIEKAVDGFKTKPMLEWDGNCWIGFFKELQSRLGDGAWDYVPNASGGFMGFWWHWKGTKYLQLEESKLCFKIEVEDKTLRANRWEEWHSDLMAATQSNDITIRRPARRRSGTWMTVAVIEGDYRKGDEHGCLDLDQTLVVLRKAESLLDSAVSAMESKT
jgi:hypothetical protein